MTTVMRTVARLVIALLLTTYATGLGATGPAAAAGEAAPGSLETTDPFPVRIPHKFGTTVVPTDPQRVVSIGYHDHESLLAVGVVPVALRYNYGDHPHGVFPWGQELLGGAAPRVLDMPGELDYEAIAALQPDLISAVYSGITQEEYARLSRIAPTLAQTGDYIDLGMPWQEQTLMIGTAVGRRAQAVAAVTATEARFEAARRAYPHFAGKKVALAVWRENGQIGLLSEQDVRSRVFTDLGFQVPEEFNDLFGDQFYAFISAEQLRLLDTADVVVWHQMSWSPGREAIEQHPIYSRLNVAKEGRHLFLEGDVDDALQFGTVLSLPYLLDRLVPMLAEVLPSPES